MATNFFFNNYQNSMEQLLLEDLIVESIRIYGVDMHYIRRVNESTDKIFDSSEIASYSDAFPIEMYIKSVDGYGGDGSFFSKFDIEIRDQIVFTVAKRVFDSEVGRTTAFVRPREADLIYFPLHKKVFEIKHVNNKDFFYQLGSLNTFELTCELFEFSGEIFDTGIAEIDAMTAKSTNAKDYAIKDEDGSLLIDENSNFLVDDKFADIDPLDDAKDLQDESDTFMDFSESDPFSEKGSY